MLPHEVLHHCFPSKSPPYSVSVTTTIMTAVVFVTPQTLQLTLPSLPLLFIHDSIIAIHSIIHFQVTQIKHLQQPICIISLKSNPLVKFAPLTTTVSILPITSKLTFSYWSFRNSSLRLWNSLPTNLIYFSQLHPSYPIAISSLSHLFSFQPTLSLN